jgi:type VI secretion system protein
MAGERVYPYYDFLEGLLKQPLLPSEKEGVTGLAWSIRNNLKMILNTRRDTLPHLPDYGLPDISVVYKDFPDSLESVRRAIANAIEKYEPRLEDVRVRLIESEHKVFRATYLVSAKVRRGYEEEGVQFKTRINSDGGTEILET